MNTKEITVGYTYTKNLGNYENVKIDAGVTISVEPGQDVDELFSNAYRSMKRQVKKGLQEYQGGL